MNRGLFITFEGGEGTGKTTQVSLLEEFLIHKGYEVLITREPGGTSIGDQIRQILLDSKNSDIKPLTELLLYAASRAQHIQEKIEPAIKQGHIVLCDRFTDATLAYQGYARNLNRELISQLNHIATSGRNPDLTILMDGQPEICIRRAIERMENQIEDESRFEKESLDFHHKVRQGYLEIAMEDPERIKIIDCLDSVENIYHKICLEVEAKLKSIDN